MPINPTKDMPVVITVKAQNWRAALSANRIRYGMRFLSVSGTRFEAKTPVTSIYQAERICERLNEVKGIIASFSEEL